MGASGREEGREGGSVLVPAAGCVNDTCCYLGLQTHSPSWCSIQVHTAVPAYVKRSRNMFMKGRLTNSPWYIGIGITGPGCWRLELRMTVELFER